MAHRATQRTRIVCETVLTAVLGVALAGAGGCSSTPSAPPQAPDPVGPVVDAGAQFAIASSRLDVRIFSLRDGMAVPQPVVSFVRSQGQSMAEPLRQTLAGRGFLGAIVNDQGLADLERMLTAVQADGSGQAPQGSPVDNVASVNVPPGALWTPLLDAPTRTEPWALALGQSVASLKPGTLRWFLRAWPAPAEAVPTAGMAGELRVQFLPVVTGPLHEAAPDPLAPPPLSTDLAARGHVLARQAFTASLRTGGSLVLIALPATPARSAPGPAAEAAPMLGQALLGSGPPPLPGGRATGPRVLVLRPLVPGTYRLLLDRAAPADAAR